MVVIAVPVMPARALPPDAATRDEAVLALNTVLSQFTEETAAVAKESIEKYGEPVAYHLLTCLDTWYQSRKAYSEGHYARSIQLVEAAQILVGETQDMKSDYPLSVVPDSLWGGDAEEEAVT
jgi:hypothetical protein